MEHQLLSWVIWLPALGALVWIAAQSLAPLYLGRAASVILETSARPPAAMLLSATRLGGMFDEDKPYLVDRWR